VIPTGPILGYLHQGLWSIAVRIPDDKDLVALLGKTGPLLVCGKESKPATVIRVVDDMIEVLQKGAVELDEAGAIIS
jgi:tRNA A37 threonylcarbamoyladenosine synthetase subunit TsaC/SUA5/YrdC